jgi:hypothetical protein
MKKHLVTIAVWVGLLAGAPAWAVHVTPETLLIQACGFMKPGKAPKNEDIPRTLPPELYALMKPGTKLDKVWLGPDYDKSKGVKVAAQFESAADAPEGVASAASLQQLLAGSASDDSPYTLFVTVVKVTHNAKGYGLWIEGTVMDGGGKVLAAFTHADKDKAGELAPVASAITSDLL